MGVKIRERFPGEWRVFIPHKGNRTAKPAGQLEVAEEMKQIIEREIRFGIFQFPQKKESKPKEAPAQTVKQYYETFKRIWIDFACRESTQERDTGVHLTFTFCRDLESGRSMK